MHIKKIKLKNFRNYKEQEIELENKINIFYGNNAQGKTNILEAIYMCAIGKSFRTRKEKEIINFNENTAIVEIIFQNLKREEKIKLVINEKKSFFLNGIKVKKLSELLGNINIVMFSPDDINILKGGPDNRRKFLDIMISQLRPMYLHYLNQYMKTLDERNAYLKQIKYENKSEEMLDIWDERLEQLSIVIYRYRKEFIDKINSKINLVHNKITQNQEKIEVLYTSNCINCGKLLENYKKQRKKDIEKGWTKLGIHRDDFSILINDQLVNVYGSQGQHRTVILSLKITEMEIIEDDCGEYPILLLDDFMSELDLYRRENLLKNMKNIQAIITCTEKLKIDNSKSFYVEKGKI